MPCVIVMFIVCPGPLAKCNPGKPHEIAVAIVAIDGINYHKLDPTRTRMLPANKAERAWKLQKLTSNTVVRHETGQ